MAMLTTKETEVYGYNQPDDARGPAVGLDIYEYSRQSALEFGQETEYHLPYRRGTYDQSDKPVVTIPAALPRSTDVYGYDQAAVISVPPPFHESLPQSQQRPRLELQQYNGLSGPGRDECLASSSAIVITQPVGNQLRPSMHLWLSLFTMICCICPIGVLSVWYSYKTAVTIDEGDYDRARMFSRKSVRTSLINIAISIPLAIFIYVFKRFVIEKYQ